MPFRQTEFCDLFTAAIMATIRPTIESMAPKTVLTPLLALWGAKTKNWLKAYTSVLSTTA